MPADDVDQDLHLHSDGSVNIQRAGEPVGLSWINCEGLEFTLRVLWPGICLLEAPDSSVRISFLQARVYAHAHVSVCALYIDMHGGMH